MGIEQRQAVRKILRVKAMLTANGAAPVPVRTYDIGKFGMCLINLQQKLAPQQVIEVAFEMIFNGKVQDVFVKAKVAYCLDTDNDGIKVGLQFMNLDSDGAALIARYTSD